MLDSPAPMPQLTITINSLRTLASLHVHTQSYTQNLKANRIIFFLIIGTGEMDQWFRALAALSKDLDLVPSIHITACNCP